MAYRVYILYNRYIIYLRFHDKLENIDIIMTLSKNLKNYNKVAVGISFRHANKKEYIYNIIYHIIPNQSKSDGQPV